MTLNHTSHQYPLSSSQREVWFDQILHPDVPLYNIGGYLRIQGPVEPAIFEKALNQVIHENDALRIILHEGESLPVQTFAENVRINLDCHDFSGQENAHQKALVWMEQEFAKPFQLYDGLLFQFALLKISADCYYSFQKYHHLIVDGWAISVNVQRVATAYNALVVGHTRGEQKCYSYQDFIQNDQAYLESNKYAEHERFWLAKYRELPSPLIPRKYAAQFKAQTIPSQRSILHLKRPFYNQLIDFAKDNNASTFHVILGVLYCYFVRTSDREDFVIGLPVLNRNTAAFKKTVGLFISVSPAWFSFGTDLSFVELTQAISTELQKNYRHQRFPVSELNKQLGLHKEGRQQLFDITLSYAKHDYDVHFNDNPAHAVYFTHGFEQNALAIFIEEFHHDEGVNVYFDYNFGAYKDAEIEQIKARFEFLLAEILRQPDVPIRELQIMPEAEYQKILVDFNDTEVDYPRDKTIVNLFEEQVEKTPHNVAVIFEGQQLSYQALNIRANQLAHYLQTLGVKPEVLVGLCVERSFEMVIGLLGILKAGGAYVPLDPGYPLARIAFMLEDSEVPVLLTQSSLTEKLPEHLAQVVCLDSEWEQIAAGSGENSLRQSGPENLVYVIYTSGSTGVPKGVMVGHSALVNFLSYMQQRVELTSTDKLLALTTLSFDIAALELYLPLITGSQTIIISREIASNGETLVQKLANDQITIMQATPATWKLLLQSGWHQLTPLTILCGGEALPNQLGQALLKNSQQLWNVYGPTETTIWSSIHDVTQYPEKPELVGRPIANTQIYILDRQLQPTPIGVAGELCIAGRGLARGYLNRPELTAEKFLEIEVFGKTQRFYKTGDLARWLPDGNLEYLGRLDHQVKIRGFRIELGEIEAVLAQHSIVQENAVIVH
ncbi:MAG TPA: amino acid adenylation domain-containing protein, partial [Thioploca sp.]|nr:amino acid adenylation domain-containing protein [Thioploca sp.]